MNSTWRGGLGPEARKGKLGLASEGPSTKGLAKTDGRLAY